MAGRAKILNARGRDLRLPRSATAGRVDQTAVAKRGRRDAIRVTLHHALGTPLRDPTQELDLLVGQCLSLCHVVARSARENRTAGERDPSNGCDQPTAVRSCSRLGLLAAPSGTRTVSGSPLVRGFGGLAVVHRVTTWIVHGMSLSHRNMVGNSAVDTPVIPRSALSRPLTR
jgi:hypothetical protein